MIKKHNLMYAFSVVQSLILFFGGNVFAKGIVKNDPCSLIYLSQKELLWAVLTGVCCTLVMFIPILIYNRRRKIVEPDDIKRKRINRMPIFNVIGVIINVVLLVLFILLDRNRMPVISEGNGFSVVAIYYISTAVSLLCCIAVMVVNRLRLHEVVE